MAKRISAIVLAAGAARLREQPKVLLPLDQKALVRHVVNRLSEASVAEIVVVAGGAEDGVRSALTGTAARVVSNPSWQDGLATTIRAGVDATAAQSEAFLFLPADMPLISAELITRFIERYESGRGGILLPAYQLVPGYPVIVDRRFRNRLSTLVAGEDLATLWTENPRDVVDAHVLTDAVVFDVDSESDYEELHRRLGVAFPAARAAADGAGASVAR